MPKKKKSPEVEALGPAEAPKKKSARKSATAPKKAAKKEAAATAEAKQKAKGELEKAKKEAKGSKKSASGKRATPRKPRAEAANGPQPGTPEFYQEVARIAYHYWEDRGRPEGSGEEDWARAEAHLLEKAGSPDLSTSS